MAGRPLGLCLLAVPLLALSTLRWIRLSGLQPDPRDRLLYLAFTLVSWPVLVALRHQQLTLLVFLITAAAAALVSNRLTPAGIFLGLLLFKPQLVVLLLLWLLTRAILLRQSRLLLAFLVTAGVQLLASFVLRPAWLQQWLAALANYRRYTAGVPSLQIFFGRSFGGLLLGVVALVALAALVRTLKRQDSLALSLAILLALTVALLPASIHWIYNQVLLIPGLFFLIAVEPASRAATIARSLTLFCLAASCVAVPFSVFVESLTHPSALADFLPYLNLLLPSFVAVALALAATTRADWPALQPRSDPPVRLQTAALCGAKAAVPLP